MTVEQLRAYLTQRQVVFDEKKISYGMQFRCRTGEILTAYNTGKVSIQGKRTKLVAELRAQLTSGPEAPGGIAAAERLDAVAPITGPNRQIFIVYGHDTASLDALELLLRRMGLEPLVLQNLPAAGDTIIEKLERYLGESGAVGYACALLTPDDEGHKAGFPAEKKYRARQNVILELGMVLARLGRPRVAILHKESVELPSDIAGLIYIPYKERLDQVNTKLYQELKNAGYNPKTEAL